MATSKIEVRVLQALEEVAPQYGYDVVAVELYGPAAHQTLRVRLERLDLEPDDMEDIAHATPWVSDVVESLDLFAGAYELEVSSPGLDRPLRRLTDFARFEGEDVDVRLLEPLDGRRSLKGTIAAVEEQTVVLVVDGQNLRVPFATVASAKLRPDYAAIMAAAKEAAKHQPEEEMADDEDGDEEQD